MLENSGFQIRGECIAEGKPAAIIVVGLNRGGTSAIAQSLHAIGISLGKVYHQPIYEDVHLAQALRAKDWKKLKGLVREYEASLPIFAWKLPDTYQYLDRINKIFLNPYYIFVYRDVFATALRRTLVHDADVLDSMHRGLDGYRQIVDFARKRGPNALHVSYEKLIQSRDEYAKQLLAFCGLPVTPERIEAVVQATSPYPAAYTRWANIHQERRRLQELGFDGNIDAVSLQAVCGWLLRRTHRKGQLSEPVAFELYVNGALVANAVANRYREDLIQAGLSVDGRAGFSIDLSPLRLGNDDFVEVKVPGVVASLSSGLSD